MPSFKKKLKSIVNAPILHVQCLHRKFCLNSVKVPLPLRLHKIVWHWSNPPPPPPLHPLELKLQSRKSLISNNIAMSKYTNRWPLTFTKKTRKKKSYYLTVLLYYRKLTTDVIYLNRTYTTCWCKVHVYLGTMILNLSTY